MDNIEEKELKIFLESVVGIHLGHFEDFDTRKLPSYIKDLYLFKTTQLRKTNILLAFYQADLPPSALDLERQYLLLQEIAHREIIFVFGRINPDFTRRMIARKIPFLEIGRQIYLPFLFLKIEIQKESRVSQIGEKKSLNPWATIILIRQILRGDLHQLKGKEIAERILISPNNVSRGIIQLERHGLCRVKEAGNAKFILFNDRENLWENSEGILSSPVKFEFNATRIPRSTNFLESGESALSILTNLGEPTRKTYAIDSTKISKEQIAELSTTEPTMHKIEVWNRDPKLTSDGSDHVDPISIFLTLKDQRDDRILLSLHELMRNLSLPLRGIEDL